MQPEGVVVDPTLNAVGRRWVMGGMELDQEHAVMYAVVALALVAAPLAACSAPTPPTPDGFGAPRVHMDQFGLGAGLPISPASIERSLNAASGMDFGVKAFLPTGETLLVKRGDTQIHVANATRNTDATHNAETVLAVCADDNVQVPPGPECMLVDPANPGKGLGPIGAELPRLAVEELPGTGRVLALAGDGTGFNFSGQNGEEGLTLFRAKFPDGRTVGIDTQVGEPESEEPTEFLGVKIAQAKSVATATVGAPGPTAPEESAPAATEVVKHEAGGRISERGSEGRQVTPLVAPDESTLARPENAGFDLVVATTSNGRQTGERECLQDGFCFRDLATVDQVRGPDGNVYMFDPEGSMSGAARFRRVGELGPGEILKEMVIVTAFRDDGPDGIAMRKDNNLLVPVRMGADGRMVEVEPDQPRTFLVNAGAEVKVVLDGGVVGRKIEVVDKDGGVVVLEAPVIPATNTAVPATRAPVPTRPAAATETVATPPPTVAVPTAGVSPTVGQPPIEATPAPGRTEARTTGVMNIPGSQITFACESQVTTGTMFVIDNQNVWGQLLFTRVDSVGPGGAVVVKADGGLRTFQPGTISIDFLHGTGKIKGGTASDLVANDCVQVVFLPSGITLTGMW